MLVHGGPGEADTSGITPVRAPIRATSNDLAPRGKHKRKDRSIRQLATQRLLRKLQESGDFNDDYVTRLAAVLDRIERQSS
jgi:hypothetical protein